ncbi:MAG: hypothetical protein AAB907_01675 [Patescibacteria group bacterium]
MKKNDILLLFGSLCFIVVAWIGFNIYHNIVTSTIPQFIVTQLKSINGSFNTTIINKLKTKENVSPSFSQGNLTPTVTQTQPASSTPPPPTPTIQIATDSAKEATGGGAL